jgi:hypothetical protein
MADVMLAVLKLVIVVGIQKTDSGSVIRFQDGESAHLLSTNSDYSYYLKLAERSLERKHPVGVGLRGHEIGEMSRADADVVSQVLENKAKDRFDIRFEGHDGTYSLQRSHPELARILGALNASLRERKQIWFVAKKPTLVLQDANFFGIPVAEK